MLRLRRRLQSLPNATATGSGEEEVRPDWAALGYSLQGWARMSANPDLAEDIAQVDSHLRHGQMQQA